MRHAFSLLLCAILVFSAGCSDPPQVSVQVPWSITGKWLIADTHSHTTFSDGALSVSKLVERAIASGCDVLAITDHSDLSQQAATPEYFAALREARTANPWLVLFGGLEWNIPPYGGREHVNILVDPAQEEEVLADFKKRFEPRGSSAFEALQWLASAVAEPRDAVLFYNHPSRKDQVGGENATDILSWREASTQFLGFEGGPGHQKAVFPGDYRRLFKTIARWDPVVATVGGTWDILLDQGQSVWGAVAVSDFHNSRLDRYPCAFARIHLQVPERSAKGVLSALTAGSFWADHGQILSELNFMLWIKNLGQPIFPGETVMVGGKAPVTVSVIVEPGPELDGRTLTVELIGNGRTGRPELLGRRELSAGEKMVKWELSGVQTGADRKSAYFRVVARVPDKNGKDLLAVTNPIRVAFR